MPTSMERERWREVARRAASERDPEHLLGLVKELNRLLEEEERQIQDERSESSERVIFTRQVAFRPNYWICGSEIDVTFRTAAPKHCPGKLTSAIDSNFRI